MRMRSAKSPARAGEDCNVQRWLVHTELLSNDRNQDAITNVTWQNRHRRPQTVNPSAKAFPVFSSLPAAETLNPNVVLRVFHRFRLLTTSIDVSPPRRHGVESDIVWNCMRRNTRNSRVKRPSSYRLGTSWTRWPWGFEPRHGCRRRLKEHQLTRASHGCWGCLFQERHLRLSKTSGGCKCLASAGVQAPKRPKRP